MNRLQKYFRPNASFGQTQLGCAPKLDSQQILSLYMGRNTPERKDYIMENLVVPVEE